jgi:hypothetical protein
MRQREGPEMSPFVHGAPHVLAIDVAVICPFAACHMSEKEPCESYAFGRKHRSTAFEGSEYDFCPVVFEVGGGINIRRSVCAEEDYWKRGKEGWILFLYLCCRAWARISCSIQNVASQAIVSRDSVKIC